jgi:hypothetical protein
MLPRNMLPEKECQEILAARLTTQLEKNLLAYAVAASAAGVGILALAQPTEAKIVCTHTHQKISGQFNLDVNHDGVVDFTFYVGYGDHNSGAFIDPLYQGNQVWGIGQYASALFAGARIGPSGKFQKDHDIMASVGATGCGASWSLGPWRNVTDRYLGLKFYSVNGDIHYGWARLSVTMRPKVTATLTSYAYQTIPNKPIIAGKTHGPDDMSVEESDAAVIKPTAEPATLGALALGARGLFIWRREESVASTR